MIVALMAVHAGTRPLIQEDRRVARISYSETSSPQPGINTRPG